MSHTSRLAGLATLLIVCASVACGESEGVSRPSAPSTTTGARADITPEEVFARTEASLRALGGIYHATVVTEWRDGDDRMSTTTERWIDVVHDVTRSESIWNGSDEAQTITVGNDMYVNDFGSARRMPRGACFRGLLMAVGVALDCTSATGITGVTVEHGDIDGRPTIVLVFSGETASSDWSATFTSRLSLDAVTYLPVLKELSGIKDEGKQVSYSERAAYEHDVVPIDSLADDFFDPLSIGVQPAPTWTPRQSPNTTPSPAPAGMSPAQDVYAHVEQSLLAAGGVYHAIVTSDGFDGEVATHAVTEQWLDIHRAAARTSTVSSEMGDETTITVDGCATSAIRARAARTKLPRYRRTPAPGLRRSSWP